MYMYSMCLFITDSLLMVCFANRQQVYYRQALVSLGIKTLNNY